MVTPSGIQQEPFRFQGAEVLCGLLRGDYGQFALKILWYTLSSFALKMVDKETSVCYTERMLVTKAIRYRLRPTAEQESYFLRLAGSCRYVWNHFLALRTAAWKNRHESLSYYDMSRSLTLLN